MSDSPPFQTGRYRREFELLRSAINFGQRVRDLSDEPRLTLQDVAKRYADAPKKLGRAAECPKSVGVEDGLVGRHCLSGRG
jgi:hypothetical protein